MRNVEIKAKVRDLEAIMKKAQALSQSPGTIINQSDVFYLVNAGRLKMRFYADSSATLVRYDREDTEGPKMSDYDLLEFTQAEAENAKELDNILKKCLGVRGHVIKKRTLFMVGQTRVHIDDVKGLGHFMELEVVLTPEQTLDEGQEIAKDLQQKLGVLDNDLLDCAYMDLINKNKEEDS